MSRFFTRNRVHSLYYLFCTHSPGSSVIPLDVLMFCIYDIFQTLWYMGYICSYVMSRLYSPQRIDLHLLKAEQIIVIYNPPFTF